MVEKEKIEAGNYWEAKEKGDKISGEITKITDGEFGKQYDIKQEDGKEITTPSHAYLQTRLGKCNVGEKVEIEYLGEEAPKLKGHQPTKIYDVYRIKE